MGTSSLFVHLLKGGGQRYADDSGKRVGVGAGDGSGDIDRVIQ